MSDARAGGIHWQRRGAFFGVAILHAAVIAMLLRVSATTRRAVDDEVVSGLVLIPASARPAATDRPALAARADVRLHHIVPRDFSPEAITYPPDELSPDWTVTAHEVAADMANRDRPAARTGEALRRDTAVVHRPLFAAPVHRAGEQSRSAEGGAIVWVSERCYLESPPPDLALPGALAHSALSRTVCPEDSRDARGDLFSRFRR